MLSLVCLRTFSNRYAAEVASSALRAHGIESTVSAPDGGAGGYDIAFASGGAKLLVNEETAETAKELLASLEHAPVEDDRIEGGQVTESYAKRWLIWIGAAICALAILVQLLLL